MEILKSFFAASGFTESEVLQLVDAFHLKVFSKGDFFVKEGKINSHLGFIEKGLLQYYVLIDGEEKTTYTTGENNFVVSLISFFKEVPALENIRAVTDAKVWMVEKNKFRQLQKDIPSFKDFYINLLEWQICCIEESRLTAITLNAQERYQKMLEKEPELVQQIPGQYLASILGVTPRHLSRIRSQVRN
ncbi:MAG: Crp/Fnr family transcriptional regulator [Chitinophagaceae bacterium]